MKSEDSLNEGISSFRFELEATIRPCREEDLPALEWYGMFTEHRAIITETYQNQQRGEALMLIALINDYPAGQVWINLALKREERIGCLWAVRVFPFLQNLGIGARLMAAADEYLLQNGYRAVEFGVEKENPAAKRFYERLGYRVISEVKDEYRYTSPEGTLVHVPIDEWIMRKELSAVPLTDVEERKG